jgi:hypothetical protein
MGFGARVSQRPTTSRINGPKKTDFEKMNQQAVFVLACTCLGGHPG